jgi:hypothetical protein
MTACVAARNRYLEGVSPPPAARGRALLIGR